MQITDRQRQIMDAARAAGRVSVDGLAGEFGVTPQTIRRDLNELCQQGLLARIHGGAVPAMGVTNLGYRDRRALAADAKQRIGAAAAEHIPDNCSVFINLGTTTEQVTRALRPRRGLVVITNNINVVNILMDSPGKELILAGGQVRPSDGGIVGESAVAFFRQFRADYAVIGASALDPDGGLFDYDLREVAVARTILAHARRAILVADTTKFDRTAPMRIGAVADLERVVTDAPPPARFAEACDAAGTALEIVPESLPGHRLRLVEPPDTLP